MKLYKIIPFTSLEVLYKIGIPVQSLNLFHVTSLLFLFKLIKIRLTSLSKVLIAFYIYSLFITLFNFVIVSLKIYDTTLFIPVLRQLMGLTFGVIAFFILREIFRYSPKEALYFLVKSTIILLVISVFLIDIILNHRFVRISATFTEPSHLGQYIVFIIIPSLLLLRISKTLKVFFVSIVGILIFLTFSFTTYVRLFILLFFIFLFQRKHTQKIKYFFGFVVLLIFGLIIFLEVFKNSYVVAQVSKNLEALFLMGSIEEGTVSLIDRMQIFFILQNLWKLGINSIWGIGFGLEKLYLAYLYPDNILNMILSVKHFKSYLNSFWGKTVVYTGFIGLWIFLYLLVKAIRISKIFKEEGFIIQATIFSIYIYALFGLAPFQSIELWFWLAFLDSLYLKELNRGAIK